MTTQNQWLPAFVQRSCFRAPQRFRSGPARFAAACFFALALSAVASAQTLSCPVNSDVTVSSTLNNVASSCIIEFGVTLTIVSTGDLVNVGPSGSGILQNNGTFSNDGDFQNKPLQTFTNFGTVFNNNTMDIGGGTFTNASIFDNFGTVTDTFGDGSLNNAATFTNAGTMGLADTVNNSVGAHFNNAGFLSLSLGNSVFAPVTTNNGTFTNFTGAVLENGTTFTNNGSLVNDGTLANGKSLRPFANFEQATLTNNGTITNNSNGTITNTGALTQIISNNGIFDNYGSVVNGSSLPSSFADFFDNNTTGSLINETGATLTVSGGELRNFGTLTNNGAITVNGGFLLLSGTSSNSMGSTFIQTAGATEIDGVLNSVPAVQIQGGTLLGFGTINGNVNNTGGIVEPGDNGSPGFLTVNGDYTQGSGETLTIQLKGASPTDFGVLDVTGLASLDGTVDFTTVGGFTPVAGDDFTFLLFGSLSGNFTNIDFTNWTCPTGDSCTEVLGANSLSLDITGPHTAPTPEPSSLFLFGTGILLIARFFRPKRAPGVR